MNKQNRKSIIIDASELEKNLDEYLEVAQKQDIMIEYGDQIILLQGAPQ